jgi:hypothetical protein
MPIATVAVFVEVRLLRIFVIVTNVHVVPKPLSLGDDVATLGEDLGILLAQVSHASKNVTLVGEFARVFGSHVGVAGFTRGLQRRQAARIIAIPSFVPTSLSVLLAKLPCSLISKLTG